MQNGVISTRSIGYLLLLWRIFLHLVIHQCSELETDDKHVYNDPLQREHFRFMRARDQAKLSHGMLYLNSVTSIISDLESQLEADNSTLVEYRRDSAALLIFLIRRTGDNRFLWCCRK